MREKNLREQKPNEPKDAVRHEQKLQTKQSVRTRLAFLAAAVLILAVEIYIAICVKGGFVRHYAGDVLAVILRGLLLARRRQICRLKFLLLRRLWRLRSILAQCKFWA